MTPEEEIRRLIQEQEDDDTDFQRPEPAAVARIDNYADRLDTEGKLHGSPQTLKGDRIAGRWECKVHGIDFMQPARPSWQARGIQFQCMECDREYHRQYRLLRKPWKRPEVKERNREDARAYRKRRANDSDS